MVAHPEMSVKIVRDMSVSYVLSWEEFLEVHESSLPRPHIASFVCTIFVATATGIFGGLLTYFVEPQDKLTASMFCWLSLVLFFVAFWDFTIRTRKCRKRVIRELRSVFDRYHGGEQSFFFDQEKWTHRTENSENEASWTGLLSAAERPNVITLATKNHMVVLPKRIFVSDSSVVAPDGEPPSVNTLRRLAFGQAVNLWQFRLGFVDYISTEVPSLWRSHPFLMSEAHAAGLLWFLMVAIGMYHSVGPGVVWGWVLAALLLFLTITTQFWYFLLKYATSNSNLRLPWEAEFSSRGVYSKNSKVGYFNAWTTFRKFGERRRCFLLYFNLNRYSIFPRRCLSLEQQTILRNLLDEKVPVD